jgi:hypothetical protein
MSNVNAIADILNAIEESPTATIDVRSFVEYFWPVFTQDVPNDIAHKAKASWIRDVAGNPNVPVDVLDPQGEVIARVPPLIYMGEKSLAVHRDIREARDKLSQDPLSVKKKRMVEDYSAYLISNIDREHSDAYLDDWVRLYLYIEGEEALKKIIDDNSTYRGDYEFIWT